MSFRTILSHCISFRCGFYKAVFRVLHTESLPINVSAYSPYLIGKSMSRLKNGQIPYLQTTFTLYAEIFRSITA